MSFAECISCGAEIKFSAPPKLGMLVTCPECDAELEIVWLDPVELDWPFDDEDLDEEDEDYEYYDDDDDDEDYDYEED